MFGCSLGLVATIETAQIQNILITESSSEQSDNLTHPLPPSWTPSTYGGPSLSSAFHFSPHLSSFLILFFVLKYAWVFPFFEKKKKNTFFLTLKPPPRTVLFISFIFFQISQICGLPPHPPFPDHWLAPYSPAGWLPSILFYWKCVPKVTSGLLTSQWEAFLPPVLTLLCFSIIYVISHPVPCSCLAILMFILPFLFPMAGPWGGVRSRGGEGDPFHLFPLVSPLSNPSCIWPPCSSL